MALVYSATVSTGEHIVDPMEVLEYQYPPVNITEDDEWNPDIMGAKVSGDVRGVLSKEH